MHLTLADGGIETRIIYEFGRPLEAFEAFSLLDDEAGRAILRRIYAGYADVAIRHGRRMQLGTPTWRASRNWTADVERVNAAAVRFLREIAASDPERFLVAGVLGPAADGYRADAALDAEAARRYHAEQAEALARLDVDVLYAPTFPAFSELLGVARAMAATGKPYALAPMLGPDGTMLDGTPLGEAIERIDAALAPAPDRYFLGCLYPTHAKAALEATRATHPAAVRRVRGLKANASPLPPAELDRLGHVAASDPDRFARDAWDCAREFDLDVLGGCCGTDEREIEAVAREPADSGS